jgi:type I restriction enzyme S subunit
MRISKDLVGSGWSETQLLSLTKRGVIARDIESGVGKYPESFDSYQLVEPGDLVFCLFDIDETPRTVGMCRLDGMLTSAYTRMRVRPIANPRFMEWYFLDIDNFKKLRPFYSGLRKVVTKEKFMSMRMSLPPLDEQKAIADFLDRETARIDKLIAKQERLVQMLGERRQAVISRAVREGVGTNNCWQDSGLTWVPRVPGTWRVQPLWMVTSFSTGWTPPSGNEAFYSEEFSWVNISDLGPRVLSETAKGLSAEAISTFRLKQTRRGQLMFSFKLSIGQVSFAGMDCYTNEAIATFGDSAKLSLGFAYYMLPIAISENASVNIYGAKMLNSQRIRAAKLLLPPLNEQQAIADFLDRETARIDKLTARAKEANVLLQERRQALISAAVTGKLEVRGSRGHS